MSADKGMGALLLLFVLVVSRFKFVVIVSPFKYSVLLFILNSQCCPTYGKRPNNKANNQLPTRHPAVQFTDVHKYTSVTRKYFKGAIPKACSCL